MGSQLEAMCCEQVNWSKKKKQRKMIANECAFGEAYERLISSSGQCVASSMWLTDNKGGLAFWTKSRDKENWATTRREKSGPQMADERTLCCVS